MRRNLLIVLVFGSSLLALGCAASRPCEPIWCQTPSRLEMDYGTSFKLSKFNQIANPESEKNLEPVTGLDGQAAKAVVEKYRKDFEKPAAPPSVTLSIGTSTGR